MELFDWFFFEQIAKILASGLIVILFAVELAVKWHIKSLSKQRYRKYDLLHHIFHWCGLCGSVLLFLHGLFSLLRQLTSLVDTISVSFLYLLTDHCTYCILVGAFVTIFQVQAVCYRQLKDDDAHEGSMNIITFGMILVGIWLAIVMGISNMDIVIIFDPHIKFRIISFGILIISFIVIVSFIQWNAHKLRETFCLLSPEVFAPPKTGIQPFTKQYFHLPSHTKDPHSPPLLKPFNRNPLQQSPSLSSNSSDSGSGTPILGGGRLAGGGGGLGGGGGASSSGGSRAELGVGGYFSCQDRSPYAPPSPRPVSSSKADSLYLILRKKYDHFIFLVRTAQLLCLIAILIQFIQIITLLQNYFDFTYKENIMGTNVGGGTAGERVNMESLFLEQEFFSLLVVQDAWIWLQNFSLACMGVYAWVPMPRFRKQPPEGTGGDGLGAGGEGRDRGREEKSGDFNLGGHGLSEVLEIQESSSDEDDKSISAGTQGTLTNWREELTTSSGTDTRGRSAASDTCRSEKDLRLDEKEARFILMSYRKWAAANI